MGLNELNQQYQQQYGAGNYVPNVFIQYWSMRVMAYLAVVVFLIALLGVYLLWRKRLMTTRWFLWLAIWAAAMPFLINTAGWVLTENGRQPWIVQGLMTTSQGVSPSVSAGTIWVSLSVFVLLYGALAVIDWTLMVRYARKELGPPGEADEHDLTEAAMAY